MVSARKRATNNANASQVQDISVSGDGLNWPRRLVENGSTFMKSAAPMMRASRVACAEHDRMAVTRSHAGREMPDATPRCETGGKPISGSC
jgi:hypothetical protein